MRRYVDAYGQSKTCFVLKIYADAFVVFVETYLDVVHDFSFRSPKFSRMSRHKFILRELQYKMLLTFWVIACASVGRSTNISFASVSRDDF
jgi:hypothetical protein